ncbi:MAG: Gluconate 5-dehydrogenase [Bradyrhizobium sp.]|nr:Gluconate 5-dehydrogenase [Bradyrhizobium sp.]
MADSRDLFSLEGRTALITGGSRGLGLQIAEALGSHGAKLILSSRKTADLEQARDQLKADGIDVDFIAADNASDEDIERLASEAVARLGRVDILVNNAGATWAAPTEDMPIEGWDKLMTLNVRSLFLLSQQIGKLSMIPNRYGRILNIASVAGLQGAEWMLAYNTSKGAVVNFTRGLAADWGKYGITVNALAPGMFETKMTEGIFDRLGKDRFARVAPLNRVGDDQDLKGAALLFTSDAGKHITAQILAIDGGATSAPNFGSMAS